MHHFNADLSFGKNVEQAWFWPRLYTIHANRTGMPEAILRTDVTTNQHTQGDHCVQIGKRMVFVDVKASRKRRKVLDFPLESHHSRIKNPNDKTDARPGWADPNSRLNAQWIARVLPGASTHPDLLGHRIIIYSLRQARQQGYLDDNTIPWRAMPNKDTKGVPYFTHQKEVPWDRFIRDLDTDHYFANHVCRRVFAIRADDTTF